MTESLQEFVRRKNIESFRRRLNGATDEAERAILSALLAEEERKFQEESAATQVAMPRMKE